MLGDCSQSSCSSPLFRSLSPDSQAASDVDIEPFDNDNGPSDRQLLQDALNESADLVGLTDEESKTVNECAFAAASIGVSEQEKM